MFTHKGKYFKTGLVTVLMLSFLVLIHVNGENIKVKPFTEFDFLNCAKGLFDLGKEFFEMLGEWASDPNILEVLSIKEAEELALQFATQACEFPKNYTHCLLERGCPYIELVKIPLMPLKAYCVLITSRGKPANQLRELGGILQDLSGFMSNLDDDDDSAEESKEEL